MGQYQAKNIHGEGDESNPGVGNDLDLKRIQEVIEVSNLNEKETSRFLHLFMR